MSDPLLDPRRALHAALRQDLAAFTRKVFATLNPGAEFQPNWHIRAMTHAVQEAWRASTDPDSFEPEAARKARRLLITVPPRYLKSITVAVAFPAWALGHDPSKRFLVVSYGGELAAKHARDFRTVVQSPWYRDLFSEFQIARSVENEVTTTRNGGRLSASLGGAVTGLGCDGVIIDDLMKAADAGSAVERQRVRDFYQESLISRLNDKANGLVIAIQQRLHEYDFAGYLLETGSFTHLNLPAVAPADGGYNIGGGRWKSVARGEALFPARENLDVLAGIRREMGPAAFSTQYLQEPVSDESNLIRWERIQTYDTAPERTECQMLVQSWDTAMVAGPQNDFSVCTTWGFYNGTWYLLDLLRVRLDYPELLGLVRAQRTRWRADYVLVEDAASGIPLLQELRREMRERPDKRRHSSWQPAHYSTGGLDKVTRLAAQSAKLEQGYALFPNEAPWLADLKREILGFPQARYDDQVDSVSQFLHWSDHFERRARHRERVRR